MGKGQNLYKRAKRIIPGGTQLLSKRPEMFLPEQWPAYYSRAKGCEVWDLDGAHYIDVSYMGIGANTLGYADEEVDSAAKAAIDNSCMCTLNAPEEVYLAQKLLDLHPWAGGVRYAKSGGEGMALAVRVARTYTGRDIVLFCGYHGWHDWYLSANLSNTTALNEHHIAGLEPRGIPTGLGGTNLPFRFNNLQKFLDLIKANKGNIAAVVMEPIRNEYPSKEFMDTIRQTTKDEKIVLVFDEITAGFRICAGGSHIKLGFEPDLAVFGKGMTNGYPLSAIIGRTDIMKASQDTFISSTFFTERVAFAAALKTIEIYERKRVWEKQIAYGKKVKAGWAALSKKHGIKVEISGVDPLAHFKFVCDNPLVYKTFFVQEMLKKGYLASTAFYASYAHSTEIIEKYLEAMDDFFRLLEDILSRNEDVGKYLEGPVCHAGFARLN